jgi:hypothetical protein
MSETSPLREPTYLRDARLKLALDNAPDAHLQASPALRNAIKNIAASALQTGEVATFSSKSGLENAVSGNLQQPPQTVNEKSSPITRLGAWAQSLWQGAGQQNKPWNAAFATLVLGSIITLIWFDKDVPDAALDERPAPAAPGAQAPVVAAPAAPAANTTVAATVPELAPAPAAKEIATPAAGRVDKAKSVAPPAVMADAAKSTGAITGQATVKQRDLARNDAPVENKVESKAESAVAEQTSAPARSRALAEASSALSAPASPRAAAPAAAPALPSALGATGALADQSLAKSSAAAPFLLPDWTQLDVSYVGRIARLARADAQNLVAQAQALASAEPLAFANAKLDAPNSNPLLQLHLLDASGVVAQFELWNNSYRWRRKGLADVTGPVTADQLTALLAQVSRNLPP